MTPSEFETLLIELDACEEAREWAKGKTWEEVYTTCERADWLLWLFRLKGIDPENRLKTLVAGHIANTVRHLMTDERSIKAVDAAIAYGEGKIGIDELEAAADAARAAAYAAAYAAARAVYAAADAAYAAARAAYAAAQKQNADIFRNYLTIDKFEL